MNNFESAASPPFGVCDKTYHYVLCSTGATASTAAFIPAASSKIRVNLGLVVVIALCIISYVITSGSSC